MFKKSCFIPPHLLCVHTFFGHKDRKICPIPSDPAPEVFVPPELLLCCSHWDPQSPFCFKGFSFFLVKRRCHGLCELQAALALSLPGNFSGIDPLPMIQARAEQQCPEAFSRQGGSPGVIHGCKSLWVGAACHQMGWNLLSGLIFSLEINPGIPLTWQLCPQQFPRRYPWKY